MSHQATSITMHENCVWKHPIITLEYVESNLISCPIEEKQQDSLAFFGYHTNLFFGIELCDSRIDNLNKYNWAYPTQSETK